MQIKQYRDIKPTLFDSDAVKGVAARVVLGKADGAGNFCMRVFEIAPGGFTPKHTHAWEHEMFIHAGEGEIFGEGRWNPVRPGKALLIPANAEHQIKNTGKQTLVVVCLVPGFAPEL